MKKIQIFSLFLLLAFFPFMAMAEFEEGHEYRVLYNQPPVEKGAPLEVVEFFWYGCIHCYNFETELNNWIKNKPADVKFTKIPAIFRSRANPSAMDPSTRFHAQVYYALELMGEVDRLNQVIFEARHKQGNKLTNQEQVEKLLVQNNVDINTFRKAMKAWHVDTKVKSAFAKFQQSQARGVPVISVNGRYISGDVKNYRELTQVIDHMVDLVRQEQAEQ